MATNSKPSSTDNDLAPLLRHFIGIDLIVETKQGRTFRGRLREADPYMNLVLSRTTAQAKKNNQRGQGSTHASVGEGDTGEQFDWVHIRGPSIRYIVFGANIDVTGVIKAGRDRERSAHDKYQRGIRKVRK